jgi:hypothetical protein
LSSGSNHDWVKESRVLQCIGLRIWEWRTFSRFGTCKTLHGDNVLNWLEHLHQMKFNCSNETEFTASHFHEIDISRFEKFGQSIVERILSSTQPVIQGEDWLYETIWRFAENDRMKFTIIQFIRFEFVSKSVATWFISKGSDFVDLSDSSVRQSLGRRFIGWQVRNWTRHNTGAHIK